MTMLPLTETITRLTAIAEGFRYTPISPNRTKIYDNDTATSEKS